MSGVVYILCGATSLLCAFLLLRSYAKNRVRLLFWSGLCFLGLGLDNVIMYIDVVLLPTQVDFSLWRKLPGLVALMALIYGLIWDSK